MHIDDKSIKVNTDSDKEEIEELIIGVIGAKVRNKYIVSTVNPSYISVCVATMVVCVYLNVPV